MIQCQNIELNKKEALQPKHFERWLELWESTIKSNFSGPKANEAIQRAQSIGALMITKYSRVKITNSFNETGRPLCLSCLTAGSPANGDNISTKMSMS